MLHLKGYHKLGANIFIALSKYGSKKNIISNIHQKHYTFISFAHFSKYGISTHFSSFSRYCQTLTMAKDFCYVYQHIQPNCPYPYPKTILDVPPFSMLSSQHDSTNYCGLTWIGHKQPSPVSNITITNQVETYSNNDDNTQYFSTSRRTNILCWSYGCFLHWSRNNLGNSLPSTK